MLIAKIINLSIARTYYLVRICGLLSWVAVRTYGISKMDKFGWAASTILLTPLSLEIASSVSADGMTVALSVLCAGTLVGVNGNHSANYTKRLI